MLKLSPHQHSAKLLPHHHTSYGGLMVFLGLAGLLILLLTLGVVLPSNADSGNIVVSAVIQGAPPSTAPVITAPANGSVVSSRQINVSGSCSGDFTVVVTSNQVGRGSTSCDHNGSFNLVVSLDPGTNLLAAHYLDNLNQSGPSSPTVTVTYRPGSAAAPAPAAPLLAGPPAASSATPTSLTVTAPFRFDGAQPGASFTLPGDIKGGTAPYALEIDWGDATQNLLSRSVAGAFTAQHTYTKAGRYSIRISASDAVGTTAFFQTTLVVNGAAAIAPATPTNPPIVVPAYELMVVWPLFLMACLAAASFWLGERYDRRYWRSPPPAI